MAGPDPNEGHDGDQNIFPGNAVALTADRTIRINSLDRGYLGDLVPPEDSDRLPRVVRPWVLEFSVDDERFRFTHSYETVLAARNSLMELINLHESNSSSSSEMRYVHIAYYYGRVFRDEVNRVSIIN